MLLDAGRTASDLQENYLEALFSYQRDVLLLESAVGEGPLLTNPTPSIKTRREFPLLLH